MANQKHNKKLRNIVIIVVAIVLVFFALVGKEGPIGNLKNNTQKLIGFTEKINDALAKILGDPAQKEILSTKLENAKVQLHIIDVGQGDCALVRTPKGDILVDGGEAKHYSDVQQYLDSVGVSKIELVIATHPHSDHIGSLVQVVENYEVAQVLMPEIPVDLIPTTRTFTNLLEAIDQKGLGIYIAEPGALYNFGEGVELEILGPQGEQKDLNNISIVSKLRCDDVEFLLTGDVEKSGEYAILDAGGNPRADVLQVAHHGSNSSSTQDFLDAVNPSAAIISCETDNSYGHPHREVMQRLTDMQVDIYRTDQDGSVLVETDGEQIAIVCENEQENLNAA